MKFKRYDKRFLPMLFIGLGIWIVSLVLSEVLSKAGYVDGQSALMEMAKGIFQHMPVITLLLLCLIQPVFEEFAFRLWGVGKMWTTIVCLALMAFFAVSEMGLWGLLFIVAFIIVWLKVKDTFKQRWINALITSACFALCHISGFGSFGWGMVLGLLDIFGMALVMCWLTINLSIWFSCLLHVTNNSLAILWPLVFVADPVANTYVMDDGGELHTELCAARPLGDMAGLESAMALTGSYDEDQAYFVGEPAQIAVEMLNDMKYFGTDFSEGTYYDWVAKNESMEERVIYKVHSSNGFDPSSRMLLDCFLKDYEAFGEESLVFDTTEVELQDIYLVYTADGSRVNINDSEANPSDVEMAMNRVLQSVIVRSTRHLVSYAAEEDSVVYHYALQTTRGDNVLTQMMGKYESVYDAIYGFSMEYVPSGKKVKLITVKTEK